MHLCTDKKRISQYIIKGIKVQKKQNENNIDLEENVVTNYINKKEKWDLYKKVEWNVK